jgi:adenine-specific DNA-methyltransferase
VPTLNWIGKDAVEKHHREVPFRLLERVDELSCGDMTSGNLIVQGDNLHALKALLPRYAGQVKCIYIDPPYNTGNEGWVYNDNVNSPEIRKWLGEVVGKEGETLDRHDRWLCMMYPRLLLLKQFLCDEGVLLVSLDDNEAANAKLLLDEIFGGGNFIAQLVWEKGRKNDAKFFSIGHEYIFVYAKSKSHLKAKNIIWRKEKEGASEIYD